MLQSPTDDKSTLIQVMTYAVRQQTITWVNADPDPRSYLRPQWDMPMGQ